MITLTLPILGRYILRIDRAALEGHKGTGLGPLESWIRRAAPVLTAGKTGTKTTNVTQAVPPQAPFTVMLVVTYRRGRNPVASETWSPRIIRCSSTTVDRSTQI
jgi:hypothetical protein